MPPSFCSADVSFLSSIPSFLPPFSQRLWLPLIFAEVLVSCPGPFVSPMSLAPNFDLALTQQAAAEISARIAEWSTEQIDMAGQGELNSVDSL